MRRLLVPLLFLLIIPAHAQPAADPARFKVLDKTMESAPPQQRLAWNALLVAYTTFRDAGAAHQPCLPPSADCLPRRKEALNAVFLSMAEGRFDPGPPSFTSDDLQNADAALNVAYEKALAALPENCPATACLSQAAFRDIQRDWIRYRDSWVTFAALRWPQVTAASWLTLLTRQRTAEIE